MIARFDHSFADAEAALRTGETRGRIKAADDRKAGEPTRGNGERAPREAVRNGR